MFHMKHLEKVQSSRCVVSRETFLKCFSEKLDHDFFFLLSPKMLKKGRETWERKRRGKP